MNLQDVIERRLEKSERLDAFLNKKVEEHFQKKCFPVLELNTCVNWGRKIQLQNLEVRSIIIAVEENERSVSQTDVLQITVAALDSKNNPVRRKGEEAVGIILFAETLDKNMIDFLDGADKKIYKL